MGPQTSRPWDIRRRDDRILVVFRGNVTAEQGRASAVAFLDALGDAKGIEIVFDVREVGTYAGAARQAWQDSLFPRRGQIGGVGVVSRSRLTRMGASVFAMVLGVPCETYDDLPAAARF